MVGLRSAGTLPRRPGRDNHAPCPAKSWQDRGDEPARAPALSRGGRAFRWDALWELWTAIASGSTSPTSAWTAGSTAAPRCACSSPTAAARSTSFARLAAWSSPLRQLPRGRGRRRAAIGCAVMLEPVAALLRGGVRHAQARRHRGAALHAVRARGAGAARRRLPAAACCWWSATPAAVARHLPRPRACVAVGRRWPARLRRRARALHADTAPDDLAVFQYTSGTTRALPEAVRHTHRSVVTLMVAALYGVGLRAGRSLLLPVVPRLGSRALARHDRAARARHRGGRLLRQASDASRLRRGPRRAFAITNLAAAPTVYRMIRESGLRRPRRAASDREASRSRASRWTRATWEWSSRPSARTPCGMYGSTEVGVIVVNYPGFDGYRGAPRRARQAGARLGGRGGRRRRRAVRCPPASSARSPCRRKGEWFPREGPRLDVDADGYFHHGGRSDDVIISAGWTMSALEIEQALLAHPDVREAAVIGVPDALRGQVPKACIVARPPRRRASPPSCRSS